MAATYKGILTNNGKALIANATVNNKIDYSHIAVGDGNGSVPTPLETRTALVNEKARIALNVVEINPNNTNQIVCEAIIPSSIGGFFIRELGLYAGTTMVVNASYPPTYKPLADEGAAREIAIKIIINIQNAEVIALYLDDSLIYATRDWVNTNYIRRNELIDNLTTNDATKPLTAKQGKVLQDTKFDKKGGAVTGSVQLTSDNSVLTVGNNKDIGFVKKQGADGYLAVAKNSNFRVVKSDKIEISSDASDTFTTLMNVSNSGVLSSPGGYSGNADTASTLQTTRTVSYSGAATGSFSFDGSANASCVLTLANSGVAAGTYASTIQIPQISVNAAGQITAISQQNIRSASVNQSGVVQLVDDLETNDVIKALTAKQGKVLQDTKLDKPNIIPSNADLNNYKTAGFYFCPTTAAASTIANKAFDYAFCLIVETAASTKQTFTQYNSGLTAIRIFSSDNNTWSSWKIIAFTDSNISANAATASKLQTARTVSYSGAATGSFSFDGSANASCVLTLENSGVAAGTYASTIQIPQISVNAAGQITAISQQNIRSASVNQSGVVQLNDTLTSSATDQALTAKQGKALQDAKFDKTGGSVSGSVQLTSDNTVLTVGIDRDIGFVKKQGAGGVLAIAKDRIFRIVGGNKAEISADASDTFTDLLSLNGSGVLSTPGGFSGNASSASKLQQQRKINDAYFDGTEDIIITAEQRVNGNIGSEAQLNAALTPGVYLCSSENGLAGLYGYGFLQVYRVGNTISQVYFPHQLSGNNENIVALRQTWNGGSSWSGWYYLGQKDSSKLPLSGGSLTGLLSSNTDIKTLTWVYAQKFVGADGGNAIFQGNASTSTKLETARNIALSGAVSGSANFDGSGNITITTTANNAIGVGQSWSDVTSSRAVNTTYTNTTGKPIQIMVTTANWNNAGSFELVLDGVSVTSFGNQDGYNQSKSVSAIVQNGATYRVNGSFTKWSELR